jgi:hypothetical protein
MQWQKEQMTKRQTTMHETPHRQKAKDSVNRKR